MLKVTYSVVTMLAVFGCGGVVSPNDTGAGGNGFGSGTTGTGLPGATVGTSRSTATSRPNDYATGGSQALGTATGGALPSTRGGAIGGVPSTVKVSAATSIVSDGGAPAGGTRAAQSIGGTGGVAASGASNGGRPTGGMGGVGTAGAANGGGAAGAMGECVPVCSRYGAACCLWQTSCLRPTSLCTIDVLAAGVDTTYEYAALESKVAGLPQDVSASITDQDIAWAAADPWPASRIEIHLTDEAATRYAAVLNSARDGRAFRVSCAGQSLFVGVFYLVYGAAALSTPVLHFALENGVSVLRLGAAQGAWMMGPSATECTTPCERIDRLELRASLCRRGVMHELDRNAKPLNP